VRTVLFEKTSTLQTPNFHKTLFSGYLLHSFRSVAVGITEFD